MYFPPKLVMGQFPSFPKLEQRLGKDHVWGLVKVHVPSRVVEGHFEEANIGWGSAGSCKEEKSNAEGKHDREKHDKVDIL